MLKEMKIRIAVLTIHGTLALVLALAFFYLSATMTNAIFEAFAVVIALMLSTAALMLAALTDFFAAFGEGLKHFHRLILYMTAGLGLAAAGAGLGYSLQATLRWLVIAAAIHALAAGVAELASLIRAKVRSTRATTTGLFGLISVALSGAMAGVASVVVSNLFAIIMLGIYMGFIAVKMFRSAWKMEAAVLAEEEPVASIRQPQAA
jgi:hypothetical protein